MNARAHLIKRMTLGTAMAFLLLTPATSSLARASSTKAIWGPADPRRGLAVPHLPGTGRQDLRGRPALELDRPTPPPQPTQPQRPRLRLARRGHPRGRRSQALPHPGRPPDHRRARAGPTAASPANWAPHNPQDYANFAIAAARRYPSVHLWMIWGEPSRAPDFEPLTPAKPFAKLNVQQRSRHTATRASSTPPTAP